MPLDNRRSTPTVRIGHVLMGGDHPVVVQSMTSTPTANIEGTVAQVRSLAKAGSELVRLTVNDFEAMAAMPEVKKRLLDAGCDVPLVGDFHYNGHILLQKYPEGAKTLHKYRINPGNVGKGEKHNENFATMIKIAIENDAAVRIGVNWGSLDQELFTQMMDHNASLSVPLDFKTVMINAMVRSALESGEQALSLGISKEKLVVSVKMSDVQDLVRVYQTLAPLCDHVFHLGLTEAGGSIKGIAASSAALGILLQQGIGDTIRMSLTPEPGVARDLEVRGCTALLQSLGLRYFAPSVVSCPGCGRTNSDKFVHLAKDVTNHIEQNMPTWKTKYPGVERLTIAVMGCVVNGPGESKHANIGISLPGSSESPAIPVYQDGELFATLRGDDITEQFIGMLNTYIEDRFCYPQKGAVA